MSVSPGLLWVAAGVAVALIALALLLARAIARHDQVAARIAFATRGFIPPPRPAGPGGGEAGVAALGGAVLRSGLLSKKTLAELQLTLAAAGLRGERVLPLFLGAKLLLLVALPPLAWLSLDAMRITGLPHTAGVAGAAVLGLLLPDFIARRLRKQYLRELERGMPDALDLMVICAEAGLALEASIARVAQEIRLANRAAASELAVTANELRIMTDRRAALLGLGQRTGIESLRRLAVTLVQTLQYGTPLAQALRVLAAELRTEQLTAFEARAARLPSLLTVPMVLFILPTVFLVVAGPAILQAFRLL